MKQRCMMQSTKPVENNNWRDFLVELLNKYLLFTLYNLCKIYLTLLCLDRGRTNVSTRIT